MAIWRHLTWFDLPLEALDLDPFCPKRTQRFLRESKDPESLPSGSWATGTEPGVLAITTARPPHPHPPTHTSAFVSSPLPPPAQLTDTWAQKEIQHPPPDPTGGCWGRDTPHFRVGCGGGGGSQLPLSTSSQDCLHSCLHAFSMFPSEKPALLSTSAWLLTPGVQNLCPRGAVLATCCLPFSPAHVDLPAPILSSPCSSLLFLVAVEFLL